MNKALAVALFAVSGFALAEELTSPLPETGPLPEAANSEIGYSTIKEAVASLSTNPGAAVREEQGWTIIDESTGENTIVLWSFTPENHPAYPSMIRRTLYQQGNGPWLLRMNIKCGAAKVPCDALVRDFQRLNEEMEKSIREKNK